MRSWSKGREQMDGRYDDAAGHSQAAGALADRADHRLAGHGEDPCQRRGEPHP